MGECLVQAGLITEANLRTALTEQKRTAERLGIVNFVWPADTFEASWRALAARLAPEPEDFGRQLSLLGE